MNQRQYGPAPGRRRALAVIIASLVPALSASAPTDAPPPSRGAAAADGARAVPPSACAAPADPHRVTLRPTRYARDAEGVMELTFDRSPYGVAVSPDGRYVYRVRVRVSGLPRRPGASWVAWAATTELDEVKRLGELDADGTVSGRVDWNKFLVAVTAEPSPDGERWTGPIALTGSSPSSLMHTMAGHGIFAAHTGPC